jgi:6-phosphogluconate dehydrogenase
MADIFADWNAGELDSFLIEITANILRWWFINNLIIK